MLSKLEITFESPKNQYIGYNAASLFQGVLMEIISTDYAEKMHIDGVKPYCQHVLNNGDVIKWIIASYNQEAEENIIDVLMSKLQDKIYIRHKNLFLKIVDKNLVKMENKQLLDERFIADGKRYIKVKFKTPVAFKSNGFYVNFPTVRLLIQSLINKYDTFSEATKIYDEETLEYIMEKTFIYSYKLKSTFFHLEGLKIPAFIGELTLKVTGAQPLVNLIQYLFYFGEYSGIGIKTAIGMGAYEIIEEEKREEMNLGGKG